MKKRKAKPRMSNASKEEVVKQKLLSYYNSEMNELTKDFTKNNKEANGTRFYLFQTIHKAEEIRDMIFNLAYFYDDNFVGNKDFMHIPNISNILNNIQRYPVLLASRKSEDGTNDILGTATIKYENNKCIEDDPYFPTRNENVLSVTGILTKRNTDDGQIRIKGIGKELYKSAIKTAYEINKEKKVRLIFEVDCRNVNSIGAALKAVNTLKEEGINTRLFIHGYYEIRNYDNTLAEAPTFICEVDFGDTDKTIFDKKITFNYLNCKKESLLEDLNNVIVKNTKEMNRFENIIKDKRVIYHDLIPFDAESVILEIGDTASGNDRIPELPRLEYVESIGNF